MKKRILSTLAIICLLAIAAQAKRAPEPEDIFAMKEVGEVRLSPDGSTVAHAITTIDRAKNRYVTNLWLAPTGGGPAVQLTTGDYNDSTPRWSPDGKKIAFSSNRGGKASIWIIDVASREMRQLSVWERSNHFLSKAGEMMCWSPDGNSIAFVAAERPAETESRDPLVISRTQYKSRTGFSDNLRSHIYIASIVDGGVRQLTRGSFDEHSINWSPRGDEIVFLSNRERDPDDNFNYDIFAIDVKAGGVRRLTLTPGVEFGPVCSPDGSFIAYAATKRALTTIDSIAEDTHVWVIGREGGAGREVSAELDRRASSPQWSADGKTIYFLAGDKGKSLIFSVASGGGKATPVFDGKYQVGSFALAGRTLAFTRSEETAPADVWTASVDGGGLRQLTAINKEMVDNWDLAKSENVRFPSYDGAEIEGWLMRPAKFQEGKKYPVILTIHGGPHGMYGYGFNHANQVYAARGYGVLYINPRGSTGYGQKFSDGSVNNWGGEDYKDLMKGVEHVVNNIKWVDRERLGVMGGSYGGFMTNWVITQTTRFKAAIAVASVSNLISFYGTSLYQDLIHVEFKGFPWDNYELLWHFSPIRYVKNVTTPTLFIHGELDNDVHITQAEEMYMGLKRRGIESVMVRYPREGHGVREPVHRLDYMNRVLSWFDRLIKPNGE